MNDEFRIKCRKLLIFLSLKYHGDWSSIWRELTGKKDVYSVKDFEDIEEKLPCKAVTMYDLEYPDRLRHVHRPPFVLYYYGDFSLLINARKRLAVIGSREAGEYGINATKKLISELDEDYVIISGMALGIDTIAHLSAIESGKKTVAVLGSGIDYCYPTSNQELYEIMKKDHLVISEYPPGEEPKPSNFPYRNRIVAGLCEGLLVTDAHEKSGTSFTIDFALGMGKTVMCVPHRIDENSLCNVVIKQGAFLVENGEDIDFLMEKYF